MARIEPLEWLKRTRPGWAAVPISPVPWATSRSWSTPCPGIPGGYPAHGALKLPPLRAVTHSSLDRLPPWQAPRLGARKRRLAAARLA